MCHQNSELQQLSLSILSIRSQNYEHFPSPFQHPRPRALPFYCHATEPSPPPPPIRDRFEGARGRGQRKTEGELDDISFQSRNDTLEREATLDLLLAQISHSLSLSLSPCPRYLRTLLAPRPMLPRRETILLPSSLSLSLSLVRGRNGARANLP